jgi:phosphonate transport system substrate-binding protein
VSSIVTFVLRRLMLAMTLIGAALPAFAAEAKQVYTLAVIPAAPPTTMHERWLPFVERLARKTGLEFRLKHYENMADFERDILAGGPDLLFSSPIQLTVGHKANGYAPLVRGRKPVTIGLFVRKDSPIRTIDELAGKTISFVGSKSICSVAMQHLLTEYKTDLSFEKEYAGSTRNVIINVLLGKSDAGSIFLPEMGGESEETRSQLRQIVETPEIASHPLSAHPRISRAVQQAVTKATLAIASTADGAQLLKTLGLANPVAADYTRDYRSLEQMDIKGLTHWGQ